MNKEKKNSDGLDNLDNYFMSITYMLKFLTYTNKPSIKDIGEIFNRILNEIKVIKKEQIENKELELEFEKLEFKIDKIINFIISNKILLKYRLRSKKDWDWDREWTAAEIKELFKSKVVKDNFSKLKPLTEALLHVVDLLSKHASIIVLNKRIISSGYDTTLLINSELPELIDLKSKNYETKYTIITSFVNAINNSANIQASTKGATIYTTSLMTPKDVYFAIQAEIKEIIYLEIDYTETPLKDYSYDYESKEVIGMLLESGIKYKKMLINKKTNKNNFLKSIIDFGYYYEDVERKELLTFTSFLSEVQYKIEEGKLNHITWVNTIFMAISYIVSFRSFDGSSKVGCSFVKEIIFGEFKQYILYSTGYNGFPNTLSHFHDKGKKEEYMVHAETNAILSIIKNNAKIHKNTIVYSNLYSCDECLKSLFNVGVEKIIYFEERYKKNSNIKDIKNSFLSDEEYFKNIWLFDKCEKTFVRPFIESFISFYKFNYCFNKDIDYFIKGLIKNEDLVEEIKKYTVKYYSNYNLKYFLKNQQHKTIFNSDLKLHQIKWKFEIVVKLIKDYLQDDENIAKKNFEEYKKDYIKEYKDSENINEDCENIYKDFKDIIEKNPKDSLV